MEGEVPFVWDANNLAHLARHGVTPDLAERVFQAGKANLIPTQMRHRFLVESEVAGRTYRLILDRARTGDLYAVTCFPI